MAGGGGNEANMSLDMRAIRFIVDVFQLSGFTASAAGYGLSIRRVTDVVAGRLDALKCTGHSLAHDASRGDHYRHHAVLRGGGVRADSVPYGARTRF